MILGSLGGIGLVIGPIGLLWLNMRRDALRADVKRNANAMAGRIVIGQLGPIRPPWR
ncbi:hypothetical protein [Tardiphaga sp.]|uniref:hypothetical protein n=1 Tax=Tardiphaga sp. TaxID=1926292 RepID=UPI00352B5D15